MSDVFREVDEELKQERAKSLARRYGPAVGTAVVLVVAVAAGWTGWTRWQESRDRAATADLIEVLGAEQQAGAADLADRFAVIAQERGGAHATLARLNEAALRAEAGDTAAAVAIYRGVAEDGGADAVLRDYARLALVLHGLGREDPADLGARLEPLAAAGSPWRWTARELQAVLALEAGDAARAQQIVTDLADAAEAPAGVRQRAADLRDHLAER